ncbi:MAG TPA: Flp pilus assembly protein CpaB [Candidatus Acidoferrales bacterium]|nr:Flp pilus assembly protein CpaB [Candidatus Acidoferrales bacterium]
MPNRLKIAVLAAVFFGFIAAYGVYNFLRQQQEAAERARTETVNIVTAAKDMPPGTAITKDLVRLTPWPKASVPAKSFTAPEQVVGKVSKVKTVAGEPILESKLTGEGAGLTVLLTPGHRAMAVRVDEIIGVSGFIAPNDRVDVISHVQPPGTQSSEKISKIVLQNKKVLSVAQSVEQKEGKPQVARSITLEVTPEEAERLTIAELQGEIFLALRAVGDDNIVQTRGSTRRDLLALASAPAGPAGKVRPSMPPPEDKKFVVEIYMGSERSVKQF